MAIMSTGGGGYTAVAATNVAAALLSIPVIAAGVWLSTQADNACVQILQWPLIALGAAILAVGLAGSLGAFLRLPWLLLAYLAATPLLVAALACLAAFAFAVTTGGSGAGHAPPGRGPGFLEYDLADYPPHSWLRARLEARWDGAIKPCLAATPVVCAALNETYAAAPAQEFFLAAARGLTPLQSGCCKPPTRCGYTFVTPTYWISPADEGADPDCAAWSNEREKYCYSCGSCKAGVLHSLRVGWRRAGVVVVVDAVALAAVYAAGCCAFRRAKRDDLFRRYRQGYTS